MASDVGEEPGVMVESVLGGGHQGVGPAQPGQPRGGPGRVPHLGGHPDHVGGARSRRRAGRPGRSPGRRAGPARCRRARGPVVPIGVRVQTVTVCPESHPAAARTVPIAPAPMTATCMAATVPGPSGIDTRSLAPSLTNRPGADRRLRGVRPGATSRRRRGCSTFFRLRCVHPTSPARRSLPHVPMSRAPSHRSTQRSHPGRAVQPAT